MNLEGNLYNRSISQQLSVEELNSRFFLLISSTCLGRTCYFETREETGAETSIAYWIVTIFRDSAQKNTLGKKGMKYKRIRWINFFCEVIWKYWEHLKFCTYFTTVCFPYKQFRLPHKQERTIEGEVHNYRGEGGGSPAICANMWSVLWKKSMKSQLECGLCLDLHSLPFQKQFLISEGQVLPSDVSLRCPWDSRETRLKSEAINV